MATEQQTRGRPRRDREEVIPVLKPVLPLLPNKSFYSLLKTNDSDEQTTHPVRKRVLPSKRSLDTGDSDEHSAGNVASSPPASSSSVSSSSASSGSRASRSGTCVSTAARVEPDPAPCASALQFVVTIVLSS